MFELTKEKILAISQFPIKVLYDEEIVGEYFADVLVFGKIIVEIKAVKKIAEEQEAQLLN
jgi:GxxExxY protein